MADKRIDYLRRLAENAEKVRNEITTIAATCIPPNPIKARRFKAALHDVALALGKPRMQRRLRIAANILDSKKETGDGRTDVADG